MRLIKYTHACVRLEQDGRTLLLDPGVFSEVEAYEGVSHILITHEHADHVNGPELASQLAGNPRLEVYAPASVAAQLPDEVKPAVRVVAPGDMASVNGFAVQVVGGDHAEIYEGLPGCANVGYIVDGVYHPGDSLFVPSQQVTTLLVPTSAPWLKLAEAIDFVRAVAPQRAFSIHDALLSKLGETLVDNWIKGKGQTDYARVPIGSSVEV